MVHVHPVVRRGIVHAVVASDQIVRERAGHPLDVHFAAEVVVDRTLSSDLLPQHVPLVHYAGERVEASHVVGRQVRIFPLAAVMPQHPAPASSLG